LTRSAHTSGSHDQHSGFFGWSCTHKCESRKCPKNENALAGWTHNKEKEKKKLQSSQHAFILWAKVNLFRNLSARRHNTKDKRNMRADKILRDKTLGAQQLDHRQSD
jgi:hypothetical protein